MRFGYANTQAASPPPSRFHVPNSKAVFAEHMAEGLTPSEAGIRMGKSPAYGNAMMQKLRADLGWQAV